MPDLVTEPDHVTPAWLGRTMGVAVRDVVGHDRIGTGQMSRNFRIRYVDADGGDGSVVIKVPAEDAALREMADGAYRREVDFYRLLADRLDGHLPACHHAEMSSTVPGEFVLVLEDLAPAEQGDQIAGCTVAEAEVALDNLTGLHAPVWNDGTLHDIPSLRFRDLDLLATVYAMAHDQFVERYGDRLLPATPDALAPLRDTLVDWMVEPATPFSLVHGDYRLDNLLFVDGTVAAVDWQTVSVGSPARDVAYFLGTGLLPEVRRAHEAELLRTYLGSLERRGVTGYATDDLRTDLAAGAWLGAYTTVLGAFAATRTDRGDDMFVAMADRAAAQILDLDSVTHLPG